MLAFMRPASVDGQPPRLNIFVHSLQGSTPMGEPRRITSETARDINSDYWKGSDTILYLKDFGGDEKFHLLAVRSDTDASSGKPASANGAYPCRTISPTAYSG